MRLKAIVIALLSCPLLYAGGTPTDFYAKQGESLNDVLRRVREARRLEGVGSARVHLQKGIYRLYEPLFVRHEDSYTTFVGDGTVISGGVSIGGWKKQGKLWVADTPDFNGRPLCFRQMWVDGKKAVRARDVASFDRMHRIRSVDQQRRMLWVPREAVDNRRYSILKAPYAELVLHEMWCVANLRVKSVTLQGDSAGIAFHDPEARIQFEHPWPSPMVTSDGRNSAFYLTNAFELLDEPGEWYHDTRTRKLYYYPRTGEDMRRVAVEVPALETLVEMEGMDGRTVDGVAFRNVTFSHTAWMRPAEKGHVPLQAGMYLIDAYKLRPKMERTNNHKLDNQGWLGRAAAAVTMRWTRGVALDGCRFEHLGGSGVDFIEGCSADTVRGCSFSDIAMNGLVAGSFSPRALETHIMYDPINPRLVCRHQQVWNNLFEDIGNEDWGCVAVAAGYVAYIDIRHNEIREVPYTGISLGWGWNRNDGCMRDNRVEANLIHHYAKHMYDCAGIYTLGNQRGTVIARNVVRDIYHPKYAHDPNHWFYLYTDEGSSYITVRDNWTPAEKFLQNANGPGNVWENNGPMVSDEIRNAAGIEHENLK
jgi:hypothetical protein